MSNKQNNIENVGEHISAQETAWTFGGNIPETFNEHIKRSVPFYEESHDLICKLSDFFIRDNSICYDLGVSTGVLINKLAQRHKHQTNVRWIGIDIEKRMTNQAQKEIGNNPAVELVNDDIVTYPYQKFKPYRFLLHDAVYSSSCQARNL